MSEFESFVIYTHSVPQAELLVEHLLGRGFRAYGDDLSDSAMVMVVDTSRGKLLRAIGVAGMNYSGWEVAQVGHTRGMKRSVSYAMRAVRSKKEGGFTKKVVRKRNKK